MTQKQIKTKQKYACQCRFQNQTWLHQTRESQRKEDITKIEKVRAQELEGQDI